MRVALTGEWQRGRKLAEQALARNPAHSGYYHAVLALIAFAFSRSMAPPVEKRARMLRTS